jgi:hypothetical protein
MEGERPKEAKAQESQGHRVSKKFETVRPNRQRDKTPEARPLWQQCLMRRKRHALKIQEGKTFGSVRGVRLRDGQSWGGARRKQA